MGNFNTDVPKYVLKIGNQFKFECRTKELVFPLTFRTCISFKFYSLVLESFGRMTAPWDPVGFSPLHVSQT